MNERLRIGDAEREAAAHELGEHYALGRITAEEHAERLDQIWAARTAADLAPPFRDLPRPSSPPAASAARPPRDTRRRWPAVRRVPFGLKLLIGVVALWWGLHHAAFLILAVLVYVVVVRRVVRRRRWWHGRAGSCGRGSYRVGWH